MHAAPVTRPDEEPDAIGRWLIIDRIAAAA